MRVLYSYDGPIAGLHDNVTSAIRPFGTPNHTYKKIFSIPGMGIIDPSSPLDPQYPAGQESKDSFRIVSCVGIPPRHVAFPAITTVLPCACALGAAMAALTGTTDIARAMAPAITVRVKPFLMITSLEVTDGSTRGDICDCGGARIRTILSPDPLVRSRLVARPWERSGPKSCATGHGVSNVVLFDYTSGRIHPKPTHRSHNPSWTRTQDYP